MHPSHPPSLPAALSRFRAPVPASPPSETVHLTAGQMKAELERLRSSREDAKQPQRSDLKLYLWLGLGLILLAAAALLIANPQLPSPPPPPKPLVGYAR